VRQMLAAHPAFSVVGECRNGAEVLQSLDAVSPDVVFLDIQMPGFGGFEVIRRRTPEKMPIVVFLTAYDEYALKAFEAEALDYLVKPVSQTRFDAAIRRVVRRLKASGATAEARLIVSTLRGAAILPVREIEWIEAADNYAKVWSAGKSFLMRESLAELELRIGGHGFVRAHRRALVRISAVRTMSATRDGDLTVELESGVRIQVSRRRRASFARAVESAASA